ncbi:hypothetical protein MRX96_024589 [Rhipicephalus microplus]
MGLGKTGATATALDQLAKSDHVPTLPTWIFFDYRLHQLTWHMHPTHLPCSATWRLRCPGLYMRSSGDVGLGTTGATATALDQRAKNDHVPTLPTRIFFDYRLHQLTWHMHPPICPVAPPGVCAVRDYICVPQAMWASEKPGRLRLRWTNVQRATTCRRCRHGSSSTIDCISLPGTCIPPICPVAPPGVCAVRDYICVPQAMWASEQLGRLRLRWTSVQRTTTCRRCRHGSSSTIDCISLPGTCIHPSAL